MTPPAPPPETWLTPLHPFTLHHLAITLICAALAAAVIAYARTKRDTPAERRIRWAWGLTTLASGIAMAILWLHPDVYRPDTSWPLHLCDIAALFTPYAMLTARRWPKTLLFFAGLGLSSQGFITPTVEQGMAHPIYWLFFLQHLGVVAGGFYLAIVNTYRPTWKDALLAAFAINALGLAMTAVNITFDVNYMYTGNMTPERPTLIDALGPWPLRLIWLAALVTLACFITLAITKLVLAITDRASSSPASAPLSPRGRGQG